MAEADGGEQRKRPRREADGEQVPLLLAKGLAGDKAVGRVSRAVLDPDLLH